MNETQTSREKLLVVLPENSTDAILTLLQRDAASDFETLSLMPWGVVGQRIVYGYETSVGFTRSAQVCAKVEAEVKKMKRAKKFTVENYTNVLTDAMVSAIVDTIEEGKQK